MDGLSTGSGVLAVISLAIELGDSIKKLCDFWQAMNGASQQVSFIISDLSVLASIAESIRIEAETPRPHTRALTTSINALNLCLDSVAQLENIVIKYQPGLLSSSRRVQTWNACKVIWTGDKIKTFRDQLKDTKVTLLLARQESSNWTTSLNFETHSQTLTMFSRVDDSQRACQNTLKSIEDTLRGILVAQGTTRTTTTSLDISDITEHSADLRKRITSALSVIQSPFLRHALQQELESLIPQLTSTLLHDSITSPGAIDDPESRENTHVKLVSSLSRRSMFGTIRLTTTVTTTIKQRRNSASSSFQKLHTTFILHPSQWLQNCGWRRGLSMQISRSSWALECSLTSYRAVPEDAPIFDHCRNGNTKAIQTLFDGGLASPWDTDSRGFTPLFVAAQYAQVDVCKILIRQGADSNLRSSSGTITLPAWACYKAGTNATRTKCVDRIDAIRLFLGHMDVWDDVNCNGLLALRRLIINPCNHPSCPHPPGSLAAFDWIFPILEPEINIAVPAVGRTFANLISKAMTYQNTKLLERLVSAAGSINIIGIIRWFSPAHFIVSRIATDEYHNAFRYLIKHGLNLHVTADEQYSAAAEYEEIRGQTPTTIAMRYSFSFLKFRNLLRSCDTDFTAFITRELNESPLKASGWRHDTLQTLFDLDFEPIPMPNITCSSTGHGPGLEIWSFGREPSWEKFLSRLKALADVPHDASRLLAEERSNFENELLKDDTICYSCQIRLQCDEDLEWDCEDSPFLFSTDF